MQITFLTVHILEFARKERNLHCDVVHITTVWVEVVETNAMFRSASTSRDHVSLVMCDQGSTSGSKRCVHFG